MAETIRLHIEVEDNVIIVTLPGTAFRVVYRKPSQAPSLIAFEGDKNAGVSQVEFLARAWRVANDKARSSAERS
jgi:hypothetical protein